jgi:hypothetical protein
LVEVKLAVVEVILVAMAVVVMGAPVWSGGDGARDYSFGDHGNCQTRL